LQPARRPPYALVVLWVRASWNTLREPRLRRRGFLRCGLDFAALCVVLRLCSRRRPVSSLTCSTDQISHAARPDARAVEALPEASPRGAGCDADPFAGRVHVLRGGEDSRADRAAPRRAHDASPAGSGGRRRWRGRRAAGAVELRVRGESVERVLSAAATTAAVAGEGSSSRVLWRSTAHVSASSWPAFAQLVAVLARVAQRQIGARGTARAAPR